jgi:phage baseplate assembly protein W
MIRPYYKLPLRLDDVIRKRRLETCSLTHSVAQNLHLVISTYRGEAGFSDEFGCSLWDEEFNIQLNQRWKEYLVSTLTDTLLRFEPRLQVLEIRPSLNEVNEAIAADVFRARRSLSIEIRGIIKKTNESFHFRDSIFISPLSQR